MSGTNGSATASPRAVVLAGGVGTRLPPHSTEFPKPLVPLGGEQAVIEVVLRQLRRQGFARITLAIGNLGGLVRAYCEDGSRWGIDLDYWTEDVPLGTMGPVIQHLDEVPEHLIVTNGDVLTDLDRRAFLADHIRSGASLSVATSERSTKLFTFPAKDWILLMPPRKKSAPLVVLGLTVSAVLLKISENVAPPLKDSYSPMVGAPGLDEPAGDGLLAKPLGMTPASREIRSRSAAKPARTSSPFSSNPKNST